MNSSAENWGAQIRAGDVRAISRAVTAIESGDPTAQMLLRDLFPSTGRAWRIGITGAAGTGKSTLTNCLAVHYRAHGKTVGIIAVDPSSPFTGGAILGDRIRMQDHASDEGVFIRSMAARGAPGGLAQAAADAALLLDAAGKDVILLETVGVGQDEIDVARVADCTIVVLVPGAGDEIQGLKAGLMEIADIFVVNKSDLEGAERFEQHLFSVLHLAPSDEVPTPAVLRTIATENKGIDALAQVVDTFHTEHADESRRLRRELAYWKQWLVRFVERRLVEILIKDHSPRLEKIIAAVATREMDPYAAAEELLAAAGFSQTKGNR